MSDTSVQIVLYRQKLTNMERSHIWRATLLHADEDIRLNMAMRRPFMNAKEGQQQIADLLKVDLKRLRFGSHPGKKYFYPNEGQLLFLTERVPEEEFVPAS